MSAAAWILLGVLIAAAVGLSGFLGPRLFEKTPEGVVTHFLDAIRAADFSSAYGDLNSSFLATNQTGSDIRGCGGIDGSSSASAAATTRQTLDALTLSTHDIPDYRIDSSSTFVVDGETFSRIRVRFDGIDDRMKFLGFTLARTWSGWTIAGYNNQLGVAAVTQVLCPGRN